MFDRLRQLALKVLYSQWDIYPMSN